MRGLAIAAALFSTAATAQERPVIVVDSYPMAFFAETLAGDAAEVRLVVPEGRDPASYRPTLAEIVEIQAADLIVLNGSGLTDWATRAALPRARTVDTGRGLAADLIATDTITHNHGSEGSHSHDGVAAHTWLDLDLAARQAETLATAMSRALPDAPVPANLAQLRDALAALNTAADALIDGAPVAVITSHPRYEYLGQAYGLEITSLNWTPGEAPDAAQLAALEALMAETSARLLIWEAAPPPEARDSVAALGLEQAVVPPLVVQPAEGDFLSAFENGLASLSTALSRTN